MEYVYILQSQTDNNFYVGWTNNLKERLKEHNDGKVFSTRRRKPFNLIYYEKKWGQLYFFSFLGLPLGRKDLILNFSFIS